MKSARCHCPFTCDVVGFLHETSTSLQGAGSVPLRPVYTREGNLCFTFYTFLLVVFSLYPSGLREGLGVTHI